MSVTLVKTDRKLDVGAGAKKMEGYETMDISPVYHPDFQYDITQLPWPFDDGAFVEVRCHHVLEHLERKHLIPIMNEMWRILATDGLADIEVPVFPYWVAIADPTHVSFFVKQTWDYFAAEQYQEHRLLYGIKPWAIEGAKRNELGSVMEVILKKRVT